MNRKWTVLLAALALALSLSVRAQNQDKDHDADDRPKASANKNAKAAKTEAVRITKGPILEWIGPDEAIIAWSTNVRASSIIRYGTKDDQLTQTAEVPYGGPTHRLKLQHLQPNTKYYFEVESTQGQGTGTSAKSKEESFTTVAKGQKGKKYSAAGPG